MSLLTTAATATCQYRATDTLLLYALKRRKAQKQRGFWAKSTYGHCIKDEVLIDPPYNTGNDFVYEDDFSRNTADYMKGSGQYDKVGNRMVTNTENNGRFYTDWLNMIYPRLKIALVDNVKPDRSPEDLLFRVMLDLGIPLSSPIERKEISGKKVFDVADGFLLACFDRDIRDETVKAIAKRKPYYAVFRDSGMANDSVAANFDQIFETYSPDTVRKVL